MYLKLAYREYEVNIDVRKKGRYDKVRELSRYRYKK